MINHRTSNNFSFFQSVLSSLYFKTVKQLLRKCCTTAAFLPLSTTATSVDRLVESADFGCC